MASKRWVITQLMIVYTASVIAEVDFQYIDSLNEASLEDNWNEHIDEASVDLDLDEQCVDEGFDQEMINWKDSGEMYDNPSTSNSLRDKEYV